MNGRARLTIGLCALAALAEGFDIQSMGVAAPTLAPALGLGHARLGPVFSASTFGLLIGAVGFGRMADRRGRRATLILSLSIFGVFTLASAVAWSLSSLLCVRVLAGLGLGGAMPNLVALAAEAADREGRARRVALVASAMPFGGAVASLLAAWLDWRGVFLAGAVAPLAAAALIGALLPESAQLLAARDDEAHGAARAGYGTALFGESRACPTLLLWVAASASLLSLYLILNWLPTLMAARGAPRRDAELISLMFNAGGGLGALGLAALFRGERRAGVFAVWLVGMALGVVALAQGRPDLWFAGPAALATGAFVSSTPTGVYALAPDFYPVAIRGAGLGAVIGAGRIGAIVGPLLAGAALAAGAGPGGALLELLPIMGLAAAAIFGLLVLRRGLALLVDKAGATAR